MQHGMSSNGHIGYVFETEKVVLTLTATINVGGQPFNHRSIITGTYIEDC